MSVIYRVHEGKPRLHYYNNTLDYFTLNKNDWSYKSYIFILHIYLVE
jgi:hypothetical protein